MPSVGQRLFIGQFGDDPTALSYLNARYYDAARGQFTSQDPVFLDIGRSRAANSVLTIPQAMNSYSYALGNPLANRDPDERFAIGVSYNGSLEGGFGVKALRIASM
jgi:RHS repeat-associated protein